MKIRNKYCNIQIVGTSDFTFIDVEEYPEEKKSRDTKTTFLIIRTLRKIAVIFLYFYYS